MQNDCSNKRNIPGVDQFGDVCNLVQMSALVSEVMLTVISTANQIRGDTEVNPSQVSRSSDRHSACCTLFALVTSVTSLHISTYHHHYHYKK